MQQKILEPLSPMTQSSLLSFAELFSFMMSEGGRSRGQVRSFCPDDHIGNENLITMQWSLGAFCQPWRRGSSSGGFADQREYEPVKSTSSQLCRYHDGKLLAPKGALNIAPLRYHTHSHLQLTMLRQSKTTLFLELQLHCLFVHRRSCVML